MADSIALDDVINNRRLATFERHGSRKLTPVAMVTNATTALVTMETSCLVDKKRTTSRSVGTFVSMATGQFDGAISPTVFGFSGVTITPIVGNEVDAGGVVGTWRQSGAFVNFLLTQVAMETIDANAGE